MTPDSATGGTEPCGLGSIRDVDLGDGQDSRAAYRVLLVEDSAADAFMVRRELARGSLGVFDIVGVDSLQAATEALDAGTFDVILADLGLPDSDGIETVTRLRALAGDIPLVVLSGNEDDGVRIDALRSGADDFVMKGGDRTVSLSSGLVFASQRGQALAQLRAVVAHVVDGAVVVDEQGSILFLNTAADRLFGREVGALIGAHFGLPLASEWSVIEILRPDGAIRIAEIRATPLTWSGKRASLASIRDITDRHRAAELERRLVHSDRLASIGQLAAGVAHEINNPATFVQANSVMIDEYVEKISASIEVMLREVTATAGETVAADIRKILAAQEITSHMADVREMAQDCVLGIDRIASIVKDLSGFSSVEDDDVVMVDVADIANTACSIAGNEIRHRAILVKDIEPVRPIAINRTKLTQVIVNLLMNAMEAIALNPSGDQKIVVSTRQRAAGAMISVEDSGCGIPESAKKQVFDPFFTTRTKDGGTGLGLSLSLETVRRHAGDIIVESHVGSGTRFDVILPDHTGLVAKVESTAPAGMTSYRVLMIDDELAVRRAFKRLLSPHRIVSVASGAEAVQLLARDDRFDVIVCDLMMPVVDGADVYESLEEIAPRLLDRIVFISGGAFTPKMDAFLARVRPEVVAKPVRREALLRVIDQMVDKRVARTHEVKGAE